MHFRDLMSVVEGRERKQAHALMGWEREYDVKVPARTLSDILDEAQLDKIDLLSLDVEGFEVEALKGLDFERHRPNFMLIETNGAEAEIEAVAGLHYELIADLSPGDALYRARSRRSLRGGQ